MESNISGNIQEHGEKQWEELLLKELANVILVRRVRYMAFDYLGFSPDFMRKLEDIVSTPQEA